MIKTLITIAKSRKARKKAEANFKEVFEKYQTLRMAYDVQEAIAEVMFNLYLLMGGTLDKEDIIDQLEGNDVQDLKQNPLKYICKLKGVSDGKKV